MIKLTELHAQQNSIANIIQSMDWTSIVESIAYQITSDNQLSTLIDHDEFMEFFADNFERFIVELHPMSSRNDNVICWYHCAEQFYYFSDYPDLIDDTEGDAIVNDDRYVMCDPLYIGVDFLAAVKAFFEDCLSLPEKVLAGIHTSDREDWESEDYTMADWLWWLSRYECSVDDFVDLEDHSPFANTVMILCGIQSGSSYHVFKVV